MAFESFKIFNETEKKLLLSKAKQFYPENHFLKESLTQYHCT